MTELSEKKLANRRDLVEKLLQKNPFSSYMQITFTDLTDTYGRAVMPFREAYLNPYGSVHGGALYTLADTVAGTLAIMSGQLVTTINSSMNYLEPAWKTTFVVCQSRMVRCGKKVAVVEVELYNDHETLLANGSFTFYRMSGKLEDLEEG